MLLLTTYLWDTRGTCRSSCSFHNTYRVIQRHGMPCNGIPLFISLDLDGAFIPQAENGEWGMRKLCPPRWRSLSKKKANWRFWKSTNMLLLSNIANPAYCSPVLSSSVLTLLYVCCWCCSFCEDFYPICPRFLHCTHFRFKPKICQKLHLNLKPNDHFPLHYFMYLSR